MLRDVIFHVGATLSSLHLRHSLFSDHSVVSPMSQLILLFCSFTYVTSTSPTSSGEPPMIYNGLYIDFIYMRLIAPYVEGNATHDRGSILLI